MIVLTGRGIKLREETNMIEARLSPKPKIIQAAKA
jgi:hypothetical protein